MILTPPFAAVAPDPLPRPYADESVLPPIHLDPLAWSRDGSWWPAELRVKAVEDGKSAEFVRSDYHRKWQAVVSGPNAAKSTKRYLETSGGEKFPVAGIEPGDVIEVGKINRTRRANYHSWRSYYVVAERTETRFVLAFSAGWTKAQALRIGNLRKALGAERQAMLASRAAIWAAIWADLTRERSSAEVEDDEAIAHVFV